MEDRNALRSGCAHCSIPIPEKICMARNGKAGPGCPSLTRKDILDRANDEYRKAPIQDLAHQASLQEAECYANRDQQPYVMQPVKTRIVEICEFARKMEYRTLGLAFCLGLAREAEIVERVFRNYGFEVSSVCCKAGKTSKTLIGLTDEETIYRGTDESMCNPIFQAETLNHEGVDFNVLLGLCVGHDTLFFQYSKIPPTVLAVKDRVTGHNPLAAIYQSDSYYKKINYPDLG